MSRTIERIAARHYATGAPCVIEMEAGKIVSVSPAAGIAGGRGAGGRNADDRSVGGLGAEGRAAEGLGAEEFGVEGRASGNLGAGGLGVRASEGLGAEGSGGHAEAAGAGMDLPHVAPGLVDLQINGYAGADFNQVPIAPGLTGDTARKLRAQGVTGFYPTVITNRPEAISEAVRTIAEACRRDPDAARSVKGIHLEGPFITPQDGPRGAHALAAVRAPDWELFSRWQDAAQGMIRIVTLSPEWPGSEAFIERCAASGVTVSIGHTAASPEQIAAAVRAGARMSTHLGNGAHLQLPRHPNYIWEQLAQEELWSCLIADGFHLPEQVLKVVMKVKGSRAILVSDAVALSGMPPGTYEAAVGGRVTLTEEGRLHLAADERLLAGSAQLLLWGVELLLRRGLAGLKTAWDMASTYPAALMGLDAAAGLAPGAPADLVLFRRAKNRIVLESTYQAGVAVYRR